MYPWLHFLSFAERESSVTGKVCRRPHVGKFCVRRWEAWGLEDWHLGVQKCYPSEVHQTEEFCANDTSPLLSSVWLQLTELFFLHNHSFLISPILISALFCKRIFCVSIRRSHWNTICIKCLWRFFFTSLSTIDPFGTIFFHLSFQNDLGISTIVCPTISFVFLPFTFFFWVSFGGGSQKLLGNVKCQSNWLCESKVIKFF